MNLVILGDFTGRNVGHNVLLRALVHQLGRLEPERILVPTLRPRAVSGIVGDLGRVRLLGVAPWHGALKFRSLALRRAIAAADLLLLVDNQLHEKGLGNPLRNDMGAVLGLTRLAAAHGVPRVYLHGSVGPLVRPRARGIAARLARSLDLVLLRDLAALRDFETLGSDVPARVTADAAFAPAPGVEPPGGAGPDPRAIAVNVGTHTLDGATPGRTVAAWAATLRDVADRLERPLILVVTHPRDRRPADALLGRLLPDRAELHAPAPERFIETAPELLARCACAVGDRYHELVMFAAAGVPIVGLSGGDKVESLFEMIGRPDLVETSSALAARDTLATRVAEAIEGRLALRRRVAELRDAVITGVDSLLTADGGRT